MGAATMTQEYELTVQEAAKILHLTRNVVVDRIKSGELKARKEGGRWRIRPSDLEDYRRRTEYKPD